MISSVLPRLWLPVLVLAWVDLLSIRLIVFLVMVFIWAFRLWLILALFLLIFPWTRANRCQCLSHVATRISCSSSHTPTHDTDNHLNATSRLHHGFFDCSRLLGQWPCGPSAPLMPLFYLLSLLSLSHGKSNFLGGALRSHRVLWINDRGFLSFCALVMHFHNLRIFAFPAHIATPSTLIIVSFLFRSSLGILTALVLI